MKHDQFSIISKKIVKPLANEIKYYISDDVNTHSYTKQKRIGTAGFAASRNACRFSLNTCHKMDDRKVFE